MSHNVSNDIFVWMCLFAAIAFGFSGLILPPLGVIDSSVLILVAQFLVFAAGVLFNSATVIKHIPYFDINKKLNIDSKDVEKKD